MRHFTSFFIIAVIAGFVFSDCARRGRPEGGPKDEDAPIMVTAKPPYLTTNFKEKEIRIYFDEYIKLKDLQKQLIVSPPLKYQPVITPLGMPSKYISIKISDTLRENTTYTFNFGQSVIDNTEGNVLRNFKYVFSTGDVIDSLEVSGSVRDAFEREADKNVVVMLYEYNEPFNDSIVYKEKPYYVGSTLDTTTWSITNIKGGKYFMVALKDADNNYMFNPKTDKIAFLDQAVTIPGDSNVVLNLFREKIPFQADRASELAKGHLLLGFKGSKDSILVNPLDEGPDFKGMYVMQQGKDSLDYWFRNNKADSIALKIQRAAVSDTLLVRLRAKNVDSLGISSSVKGTLDLRDTLRLYGNIPLVAMDTAKIRFIDSDSARIAYRPVLLNSTVRNGVELHFEKKYNTKYKLKVYPQAITDFFGNSNKDTLNYNFSTKSPADYGNLYLTLQNVASYPIIVQLLRENGETVESVYATEAQEFRFLNLVPAKYRIRVIYDENKNHHWDTGNFLLKRQPEKVVYYPEVIDVRANWEMTETFVLN